MTAPMSEHQFRRLIASHGCKLQPTGSGELRILKGGLVVCYIAISHGSKREVKPVYVKRFKKEIERLDSMEH